MAAYLRRKATAMEVEQEEAGEVEEVTRTTIKMLQAPANLIDE
jgi:hypothetical protein